MSGIETPEIAQGRQAFAPWLEAEERSETVQCRMFLWRASDYNECADGCTTAGCIWADRRWLFRFFALYNLDMRDGRRGRNGHDVLRRCMTLHVDADTF